MVLFEQLKYFFNLFQTAATKLNLGELFIFAGGKRL